MFLQSFGYFLLVVGLSILQFFHLCSIILASISFPFKVKLCADCHIMTLVIPYLKTNLSLVWQVGLSCIKIAVWLGDACTERMKCYFTKFRYTLAFIGPLIITICPTLSVNFLHTMTLPPPKLADIFLQSIACTKSYMLSTVRYDWMGFTFDAKMNFRPILILSNNVFCISKSSVLFYLHVNHQYFPMCWAAGVQSLNSKYFPGLSAWLRIHWLYPLHRGSWVSWVWL